MSLGYSMLTRDLTITCHAVGFDPFVGFYHQPRFGRPALGLDLMEGFVPLIVDSAVITAINTRMVTRDDFIQVGPGGVTAVFPWVTPVTYGALTLGTWQQIMLLEFDTRPRRRELVTQVVGE